MASGGWETVVRHLFDMSIRTDLMPLSDQELLKRYVEQRDQHAFGTLVRRHGGMVWNIGWRILGHSQDAEDNFQTTFLILGRKAASMVWHEKIDGWLHNVAYKLATKAKVARARRHTHEKRRAEMQEENAQESPRVWELSEVLDKELMAMPEKFGRPLRLRYLEGMSREQVSQALNIKLTCLDRLLTAGRERLRAQLVRKGMTTSDLTLGAVQTPLS